MKNLRYIKLSSFIFIVVLTAVLSMPPSWAASDEDDTADLAVKELSGTVANVDVPQSLVIIKPIVEDENSQGTNVTVYVNEATTIEKDGNPIELSMVMVDDDVDVSYTTDNAGKNVAIQLDLTSKEPPTENTETKTEIKIDKTETNPASTQTQPAPDKPKETAK